ncbi:MAG: PEP-CTERM sorting domain-containing protein [Phycisphaerales bacterium]
MSADGSVVAVQNVAMINGFPFDYSISALWTEEGGLRSLGTIPGAPGTGANLPKAISGDGRVVVGIGDTPGGTGFRWSDADGWEELGQLPGGLDGSVPLGVSYDGSVIVGSSRSGNTSALEAFRWTRDGMVGLGDLPGGAFRSDATACSADGNVIVGSSYSGAFPESFRWTQETGLIGLGFYGDMPTFSTATAVSADGQIIVGWSGYGPWMWDAEHGMRGVHEVLRELGAEPEGWFLGRATGVAHLADGTIVICGTGDSPTQTEAWVVTIPAPTTGMVLLAGASLVLRRRRERR